MIPILGLVIGLIIGIFVPGQIPIEYSIYVAIAILAALDSVMGGGVAYMKGNFDIINFISGFVGNIFLAVLLTFIGEKMGIQLYLAAIVAFGTRLFNNFAETRRLLINRYFKNEKTKDKNSIEEKNSAD